MNYLDQEIENIEASFRRKELNETKIENIKVYQSIVFRLIDSGFDQKVLDDLIESLENIYNSFTHFERKPLRTVIENLRIASDTKLGIEALRIAERNLGLLKNRIDE